MRVPLPIRTLLLSLLIAATGCFPKVTKLQLKIEAKDDNGIPISGANVLLNGEQVGSTDSDGRFAAAYELKQNSVATIEVKKMEASSYYSPYFESFKIANSDVKEIAVSALLYSVPKSSIKKMIAPEKPLPDATPLGISAHPNSEEPQNTNVPPNAVTTPIMAYPIQDVAVPKKINSTFTQANPDKPVTVTIHTFSGNDPVKNVKIYWGDEKNAKLIELCETNQRGRCLISLPTKPSTPITILAERSGFQTLTITSHINAGNDLRLNLTRGYSLDIFAIEKYRNKTRGLPGVEVAVKGSTQGLTDKFGHFSYHFKGQKGETFPVDFKTSEYLPEEQSSDFTVGEHLTMVKYFTPTRIPPYKIAILNLEAKSDSNANKLVELVRETMKDLPSVKEIKSPQLNQLLDKYKLTQKMLLNGWEKTDLFETLDAVLLVQPGIETNLDELVLLNNQAKVIQAALADGTPLNIDESFTPLKEALIQIFTPVATEGSIIDEENRVYQINLGYKNSLIKMGTILRVSPLLSSTFKNMPPPPPTYLKITDIKPAYSKAKLVSEPSQSQIEIGDRVIAEITNPLEKRTLSENIRLNVTAIFNEKEIPVTGANIYVNRRWIGISNSDGAIEIPINTSQETSLVVSKRGYTTIQNTLAAPIPNDLKLNMIPSKINLVLQSIPAGVPVAVNGQVLGNTPYIGSIPNQGDSFDIKLMPTSEYQSAEVSITPTFGTINLSEKSAIILESDPLDHLKKALAAQDIALALQESKLISTDSKFFAIAHQLLGSHFLTIANDPISAVEHYQLSLQATTKENDPTHLTPGHLINLGIAYFMAGEKFFFASDKETSLAHFKKANETILQALKDLQSSNPQENSPTLRHGRFYLATTAYRIGQIENSAERLHEAGEAFTVILQNQNNGSTAETYFKHTAQTLLPLTKLSLNGSSDPKTL